MNRLTQQTLVIALTCVALMICAGSSPAQTAGPGATAQASTSFTMTDGVLQITIPPGWEPNPRLASDNGVVGFIHPSGMKPGDEIPVWLLVERRERSTGLSFDGARRGCLMEGEILNFVPQDSVVTATISGKEIHSYTFQPSPEGWHRGLSFLESPRGMILFRYQALTADVWQSHKAAVEGMLRSIRFLPNATAPK